MPPASPYRGQLHVPDVIAIFADRPVRGEPADLGRVQHAGAPPRRRVAPPRADLPLGRGVGVEVRGDQKMVVIASARPPGRGSGPARRARTAPEPIASSARRSCVEPAIVSRASIPLRAALPRPAAAVRPKMKMLSAPDAVADFDVGAVQRADGQRAVQRQLHVAGARRLHARRWRSAPTGRPPE